MKYLSVCSGIEAATVAWHPLGWKAYGFSEIEKFPCSVLAHHYPRVPNFSDMTRFKEWPDANVDVLVGGTPCQSFSIAGLRRGLDDPRGNLMLTYLAIADKYRPKWVVWENVPGVLSSNGGRDFASLLRGLAELGYGFAYRVLDAQYFGVPQRRRRVFVVGCLGDWRSAAAVLFECHSMSGDPAPSRQKGQEVAPTIRAGASNGGKGHGARSGDSKDELIVPVTGTLSSRNTGGGGLGTDFELAGGLQIAGAITSNAFSGGAGGRPEGAACNHFIAVSRMVAFGEYVDDGTASAMKSRDYKDATDLVSYGIPGNWIGRSTENGGNAVNPMHCVAPCLTKTDRHAVAFQHQASTTQSMNPDTVCPTLDKSKTPAVAVFKGGQGSSAGGIAYDENLSPTLSAADSGSNRTPNLMNGMKVRRLTPMECERLQGFPDGYTLIPVNGKPAADGPRYKALGNSMAVPVMHWIGERIQAVDSVISTRMAA